MRSEAGRSRLFGLYAAAVAPMAGPIVSGDLPGSLAASSVEPALDNGPDTDQAPSSEPIESPGPDGTDAAEYARAQQALSDTRRGYFIDLARIAWEHASSQLVLGEGGHTSPMKTWGSLSQHEQRAHGAGMRTAILATAGDDMRSMLEES